MSLAASPKLQRMVALRWEAVSSWIPTSPGATTSLPRRPPLPLPALHLAINGLNPLKEGRGGSLDT